MIAALVVGAVVAVQGATSLAAGGAGAKLAITQTVSGSTKNISLTGTGWPANSTVDWTVAACTKVMGKCTTFSNVVLGSSPTDASGSFSTGTVDTVPCGSNQNVIAEADNPQLPKRVDAIKKLAC
jgi:hypothetical protein